MLGVPTELHGQRGAELRHTTMQTHELDLNVSQGSASSSTFPLVFASPLNFFPYQEPVLGPDVTSRYFQCCGAQSSWGEGEGAMAI